MPHTPQHATLLLSLIRNTLWDTVIDNEPTGDRHTLWRDTLAEARRQTVTGITFPAISTLPDDLMPPDDTLIQWVADADTAEHRSARFNSALASLFNLFSQAGLQPVLLKGQGIAALYPQPALRQCGDIDLLFADPAQDRQALRLITARGINVSRMSDGSHTYMWHDIEIEHHPRMIDIHNPLRSKAIRSIIEAYPPSSSEIAPGITALLPSTHLNLLLLSAHIFKHAIGHGIGLRQFCDFGMLLRHINGHMRPSDTRCIVSRCGLSLWMDHLLSFMVLHLGMPRRYLPYEADISQSKADRLMRIVLRGGNFGKHPLHAAARRSTPAAFIHRAGFSMRVAPAETIATILTLAKGTLHH